MATTHKPLFAAFSTQKGGVGKTTFTILTASYLHYMLGYDVAVIDCDFPQWSVYELRKREAQQVESNSFYQTKAANLFSKLDKPTYPILCTTPEEAIIKTRELLATESTEYDIVLFDLPGSINNSSVVETFFAMDYVFVPISSSRLEMESTLPFIISAHELITINNDVNLKEINLFWNKVDKRENTRLYEYYEDAINSLGIPIMKTRIPDSSRYKKEQAIEGHGNIFLSTIFPPDKPLLKDSNLDLLVEEIISIINPHK